jgi:hypothetical protein
MGADGTERTVEMQPEKEGCERKPALVEIRRGGRRCAGCAGWGWEGRTMLMEGMDQEREIKAWKKSDLARVTSIDLCHASATWRSLLCLTWNLCIMYVVCVHCSRGQRPIFVHIPYKL